MPEIDLRKLREMQLAQSQSPSPSEEESSHNTSSLGSEESSGIIDLGASSPVPPVHLENSVSTKPVKKDVWIDIPHERVMETPEDTSSVKAKPIKISLSSLSQHQKQKDPERLYQEKEEALGKIFGDTTEIVQESSNVRPSLADNNVQEVPQNIQAPVEVSAQQDVIDSQGDHREVILDSSDHSEVSDTSHEGVVAVIAPDTVSQTDLQFPQSEIYPDVDSSSGVSTIIPQTENIQMQQEYPIESISEGVARDRANDIPSAGVVASTEAGFFPELSFITPVNIPKGDNDQREEDPIPAPVNELTTPSAHILTSEEVISDMKEPAEATITPDENIISDVQPSTQPEQDVPIIGVSEDAKNMIVSSELNTPVSTEVSQASIEATPPTEANQQDNISSLHETNKKSLRWVVCGVVVMLSALAGGGVYLWQKNTHLVTPSSGDEQVDPIVNIADLPKNATSTGTDTGATVTMTGSTGSGALNESTGSTVLVATGVVNTSSGSLAGSGILSSSGTIFSGVLAQSGTIQTPPSSGSGVIGYSGSLTTNTSTGKVVVSTGSIAPKPNMNTGSLVAPNTTPSKYLEGRDYKVYGGGYKLVRTVKKK